MNLPELCLRIGLAAGAVLTPIAEKQKPAGPHTVLPFSKPGIIQPGNHQEFYRKSGLPEFTVAPFPETPQQEQLSLVLLQPGVTEEQTDRLIDTLNQKGGRTTHLFPQKGLMAEVPDGLNLTDPIIFGVYRGAVDEETLASLPEDLADFAKTYNLFLQNEKEERDNVQSQEDLPPLINDAFTVPAGMEQTAGDMTINEAPRPIDTSVYFTGRVAVGIILPESNEAIDPSTEDWTLQERDKILSEIIASLNWWAEREPRANLLFVYNDGTRSPDPTGYEPISRSNTHQTYWIDEIMTRRGYTQGSIFEKVRAYDNWLRDTFYPAADWAFTIFVVDSSNDPDGMFSDGYFAYAYIGGPYIVMTYDNNGYGPENMDVVSAHEIGHIFLALDQYSSAYQPCTRRSGYLSIENQNSQYGNCSSDVASIMRGGIYPYPQKAVDFYARGQLGWTAQNSDRMLYVGGIGNLTKTVEGVQIRLHATLAPYTNHAWPYTIHINRLTTVLIKNIGGQIYYPDQLILSPDGQTIDGTFVIPPDQQRGLIYCAVGLFGGSFCDDSEIEKTHIPIILKVGPPSIR